DMGLQFNKKSVSVTFTTRRQPQPHSYILDGGILPQENVIKHLGIYFSSDLGWKCHIESVEKRVRRLLYYIGRFFKLAPVDVRVLLYNQLVLPVIEYAGAVWDPWQDGLMRRLEALQRLAARVVTQDWSRDTCITNVVAGLGWAPLEVRRQERRLLGVYKILNHQTILSPDDFCAPAAYLARADHHQKLHVPFSPTNRHMNSFFPRTIRDWNELDTTTVNAITASQFSAA